MADKIRVLIVSPNDETREGIRRLLEYEDNLEVVGTAEALTLDQVGELRPAVVLLHLAADEGQLYLDDLEKTSRAYPASQFIIISTMDDASWMRKAFQAGAFDFVTMPIDSAELTHAIERAAQEFNRARSAQAYPPRASAPVTTPAPPGSGSTPHQGEEDEVEELPTWLSGGEIEDERKQSEANLQEPASVEEDDFDDAPDWLTADTIDDLDKLDDYLSGAAPSEVDERLIRRREPLTEEQRQQKRTLVGQLRYSRLPGLDEPDENVQFTVFHAQEAIAAKWYTMLVYAHLPEVGEQIRKDASKFKDEMGVQIREARGKNITKLARGTELRFVPEAEGVEFKPTSISLRWDEDMERANFRFRCSEELIQQPAVGTMSVYVGPLEIASVRFAIQVVAEQGEDQPKRVAQASAAIYQRIFASYSHRDTAIVQACTQAFKALGHEILIDYDTLRSGDVWDDRLLKMIEEADVFQLFWSSTAHESPAVEKEWRHALTQNKGGGSAPGAGFIRPVYWENPMPEPPDELKHIHFKHVPELAKLDG
jgi:DNA-binding NarL/FixJ family response regulator